MRVFHFILGKADKNRANGVNQVIAGLAKYSARADIDLRVIGKANSTPSEGAMIERDGFQVQAFTNWNKGLKDAVRDAIAWCDVVHLHGVFNPSNLRVASMCMSMDKPYLITLHGGLSPERRKGPGRPKKWLFDRIFQDRHLAQAAAIHALTEEEATEAWSFANPQKVAVVPNGIDLEDFPSPKRSANAEGPVRFGYIGRLAREKNIVALCEAFSLFNKEKNHRLVLAGPETPEAEALVASYRDCGVEFVGPRFGDGKLEFLQSVDIFVHPSLTDVFSIGAMEAMAVGLPTVITRTSQATYFQSSGAIEICEPTAHGLLNGLQRITSKRADWDAMSLQARRLVEERLNWSAAVSGLSELYSEIKGSGISSSQINEAAA